MKFDEPQHVSKEHFLHKFQYWRERLRLLSGSHPDKRVPALSLSLPQAEPEGTVLFSGLVGKSVFLLYRGPAGWTLP